MKPAALPVIFDGIPAALKREHRWLLWKFVKSKKSGKWAKVPFSYDGKPGSATDPSTWASYDDVADAYALEPGWSGLGFVLGDGFFGIDPDDCRSEDGTLSSLANDLLDRVDGYAEVSPSGTGIKIITKSSLSFNKNDSQGIGLEAYSDKRYFAITGHQINGHAAIPEGNVDLSWLPAMFGEKERPVKESEDWLIKRPLDGWSADRIREEILPFLDPDMSYNDWMTVCMALYHQFDGDENGLSLWDEWSSGGSAYSPEEVEEKWATIPHRTTGAVVTLATLIKWANDNPAKKQVVTDARRATMQAWKDEIDGALDEYAVEDIASKRISVDDSLSDLERETLAKAIQAKVHALSGAVGRAPSIDIFRQWVSPVRRIGFPDLSEEGAVLGTVNNVRAVCQNNGIIIRYNVMTKEDEILIPNTSFTVDNKTNASLAFLTSECARVGMPTHNLKAFVTLLADQNQYNPISTWIDSRKWDGVDRLAAWYATISCDKSHEEHKRVCMKRWAISAIVAAFSPDGVKAEGILTLQGVQGIGKTEWFMRLGPSDFIQTGHTLNLQDKDSIKQALSYWLTELGELDATFKKSEIAALKSFSSKKFDTIRKPYAQAESRFARRSVFGASVNDSKFLVDPTGNRRYWTIETDRLDTRHGIDMQQLWAQVKALWESGESHVPTAEEFDLINHRNLDFTQTDPVEEMVAEMLNWQVFEPENCEWMTATEIAKTIGIQMPTLRQCQLAGSATRKFNGQKKKRVRGYDKFAVPLGSGVVRTYPE